MADNPVRDLPNPDGLAHESNPTTLAQSSDFADAT